MRLLLGTSMDSSEVDSGEERTQSQQRSLPRSQHLSRSKHVRRLSMDWCDALETSSLRYF